jgi:cytochrome c oxidase subunit 2
MIATPGFSGNQTSLNPVGPGAAHIESEFALIFWITLAVYVLVLIAMVVYVVRRRHSLDTMPEPVQTTAESERRARWAVGGAMVITVLLLFTMMIGSFVTGHALGKMNRETAYTIDVYGHQWWWEVHYPNNEPDKTVVTANEIHVPLGVRLRIHGTSRDVIHSFWAPNVQGKRDLMPGYDTDVIMQVDQPGRWRGQCAEYCGEQHAHMSFYLVAEPGPQFNRWLEEQAKSSIVPTTQQTVHGQQVFLSHACVMCHTIRGTPAGSQVGPDLTHLASRETIAAGVLPNNTENLSKWIQNAQAVKPGCRMPPNQLTGSDLRDLLAYLETLR